MLRRSILFFAMLAASLPGGCATPAPPTPSPDATIASQDTQELLDYLKRHNTTGFLVMQDDRVLVEKNWPAPESPGFPIFVYGATDDGQLLEDVASQQKSFVSVLVAIAIDKGLIDVSRPVSDYLGAGWSNASPAQEAAIRVIDVLTMSSGLDEKFAYAAPPGSRFFYNTPVYAATKQILTAAAKAPLDEITRAWLTEPLGMSDTAWRQRPAALSDVGNATGLVTTPRDIARFGQMILHGGISASGVRVVSPDGLRAMFEPSPANPSYGRLWWLNGGAFTLRADGKRREGQLIPSAPADMVAALGFLDRRLYIVPSRRLVVVRTGAAVDDPAFDEQLWQRLRNLYP
jgi:CubicO group peptidase (beta-lactamase class C family)